MKTEAVSASGRTWTAGDYLTHRFNPELGIGCVAALDGRALIVEFPHSSTKLRLAAHTDALIPVDLAPGVKGGPKLDQSGGGKLDHPAARGRV